MSLVINHNMMAANTARNLNAHYSQLSKSTERLSTGLRDLDMKINGLNKSDLLLVAARPAMG